MSRIAVLVVALLSAVTVAGCTGSGSTSTTDQAPPIVSTTGVPDVTTTVADADSSTTSVAAPETTTTSTVPLDEVAIRLVEVDSGFDNPVLLVAAPDGGADLVVEQPGRIVRADGGDHEVVLDITGDVQFGGERGLLGLAVHPDFAENGLVYINYSDTNGDTVIEEFEMVDGHVDVSTRRPILTIEQPAGNHNGGMLAFGPDGYLWIGMGDGGAANDDFGNGQNPETLLASMLRIVVGHDGVEPYGIPPDNPYSDGGGGRPEVWAIGLRNPWRFTFDGDTVWIADVGQGKIEEVNAASASEPGLNYGWSIMEGTECFEASTCDMSGLVLPITEYTHDHGCSITGGIVYTGTRIPSLTGQFFFADYCTSLLRSIAADGTGRHWTDMVGTFGNPTGFGVGSNGEIFVVNQEGSLFTIEAGDNG